MTDIPDSKRLVFPFVAPLYRVLAPYVYPLVRISLGAILMPHGYDKLFLGGAANTARNPLLIKLFGNGMVEPILSGAWNSLAACFWYSDCSHDWRQARLQSKCL